jgi:beta-lactamase class A
MLATRRLFVTAIGAALASCGEKETAAKGPPTLDIDRLKSEFPKLAERAHPGAFGFGVELNRAPHSWVSDGDSRFPLQSVFKAPMAAAALAEVDAGRLTLSEPITITDVDLSPPYSRINEQWPTPTDHHSLTLPAIDLIALAVQRSDNTAADVIMKRIGGPGAVTAWLRGKSIPDISIDRYERELQQELAGMEPFRPAWKDEAAWIAARATVPATQREAAMAAYMADPRDTATVPASLEFLHQLYLGNLLSPASTRLLIRLMTSTFTGATRLRAGLPAGSIIAHKTGSARTDLGLTPATNEIALVTLPNGRRLALAAFLAGSTATAPDRDKLIADAARLAVSCIG